MERTLILLKPDTVERGICGKIITRIEDRGLKLVGMKMLRASQAVSRKHYEEHVNKPFYPQLESFLTAGPMIAMCVEGPEAVRVIREMMGKTNCRDSAPGTIRGDYGLSRQMNLIHGSDSPENAAREIAIDFRPEELQTYSQTLESWLFASDEVPPLKH